MSASSLSLLLAVISVAIALARASRDGCKYSQPRCHNSQSIRFPFRYANAQPYHCGYPGFKVYCTKKGKQVLHLPHVPIKVYLREIDYYKQEVKVDIHDYYYNSSFPRNISEFLNLSSTPFRFRYGFARASLLNCSILAHEFDCIENGPRSMFCSVPATSPLDDNFDFRACPKLHDYIAPLDSKSTISPANPLTLTWSKPSCKSCERQGMGCRFKNGTRHGTECFDPSNKTKGHAINLLPIEGSVVLCVLVIMMISTNLWVYQSDKNKKEDRLRIEKFLEDYTAFKPSRFSYADVRKITNRFEEKLGQGAYGTVYKGKLSGDIYVAVKILNHSKRNGEDFRNEVATMGRIHHVNIVRLVGFCADGYRRALVYEFLPNYSLDKHISLRKKIENHSLSWKKLQAISLGIAKGLEYLHHGCDQRILHFDIKPHNILLDQNFIPKISDFGMAKLCSKDQSTVSMTTARGTMGYIAPEVFSRNFGNVSYKSDVYSFGMLLLEMVGGRKNNSPEEVSEEDNDKIYYPEWIYSLLEEGEDLRIQSEEEEDGEIAKKLAIVGLWCIQWHPIGRPTMKVAVRMLEGGEELAMPPNPFASAGSSSTIIEKNPAIALPLQLEAISE